MTTEPDILIILTPGFPADEDDSVCMPFPQAFVKNLKIGYPGLHIVVMSFQYPFFAASYPWHDVDVNTFGGQDLGGWRRQLIWWKVLRRIRAVHCRGKVVGILSFWLGEAALVGTIAARLYRHKHFTWLLGQDARIGNRYIGLIRPSGANLVALSDFVADELALNYHIRPAHVIPAGIDISEFQQASPPREIDLLAAGSLVSLKRFEQVIGLIQELNRVGIHAQAVICGDGPERKTLEKLILDLGLRGQIILCGELPHPELLRLMKRTRVLVHPSVYEGFSTVCTEALYAGAHVVSYVQPMKRAFDHWHVVPTEDQFRACVITLLTDTSLDHRSVLTYPMEEICRKIFSLFR